MAQMLPIDSRGRITIPPDIQSKLDWKPETILEIVLVDPVGRGIMIRESDRRCSICGVIDPFVHFMGYACICTKCWNIIKEK